jgi:hypothetical protein
LCIRFYVNLGKNATETLAMIRQAFKEESLGRTLVFENELGSGQPEKG